MLLLTWRTAERWELPVSVTCYMWRTEFPACESDLRPSVFISHLVFLQLKVVTTASSVVSVLCSQLKAFSGAGTFFFGLWLWMDLQTIPVLSGLIPSPNCEFQLFRRTFSWIRTQSRRLTTLSFFRGSQCCQTNVLVGESMSWDWDMVSDTDGPPCPPRFLGSSFLLLSIWSWSHTNVFHYHRGFEAHLPQSFSSWLFSLCKQNNRRHLWCWRQSTYLSPLLPEASHLVQAISEDLSFFLKGCTCDRVFSQEKLSWFVELFLYHWGDRIRLQIRHFNISHEMLSPSSDPPSCRLPARWAECNGTAVNGSQLVVCSRAAGRNGSSPTCLWASLCRLFTGR